jgi:hypothetical protein
MSKTGIKKGRKSRSKKSSLDDDNENDQPHFLRRHGLSGCNDDENDQPHLQRHCPSGCENSINFKILSKKVLLIQNNHIDNIKKSFVINDGIVALSYYQ